MSPQRATRFDPEVTKVLEENEVTIDGTRMTLWDAIAREKNERPSEALAIKLHNVLRHSDLCISQKNELFGLTGWQFMCISCQTTYQAKEFGGTGLHLWGPVEPPRVMLRGGSCMKCQEDQKNDVIQQAIKPFKMCMPPECQ